MHLVWSSAGVEKKKESAYSATEHAHGETGTPAGHEPRAGVCVM
jgi:hypothetical protein